MQKDMETRVDEAYEVAGLDRKKYRKAKSLFETVLRILDKNGVNEEEFKPAFEEIGELVLEAEKNAGVWGNKAT